MGVEMDSSQGGAAVFTTTQWGLILESAGSPGERAEAALAELCRLYWRPIYAFIRRRGYPVHDAQDLTQDFFAHLLGSHALGRVDRTKGRFRSFLLASLQHFLSDAFDRAHAQKRGGGRQMLSLDDPSIEADELADGTDQLSPEKAFEARWAASLLAETLQRLRGELAREGKARVFDTLREFLTADRASSYEAAAAALGMPVGTVKTTIHELRKRYRETLRREIARTVADPSEVDAEIQHLCAIV